MSQENVEIVRLACEAVQRGDWDAAMEMYAPDVALDVSRMPGGGLYEGRDQVRAFFHALVRCMG